MSAGPELRSLLRAGLEALDQDLNEVAIQRLLDYLALLRKWNQTYNLTAIIEPEQMITYHLLDSLSLLSLIKGTSLLDVGTGAGLPGIPLSIARPDLGVTLLDGNGKKTRFVTQVAIELGLKNVKVEQSRIESFRTAGPGYDNIVSRAFGELDLFRSSCLGLLSKQGQLLAMKGRLEESAISEMEKEGFWAVKRVDLPRVSDERHILVGTVD